MAQGKGVAPQLYSILECCELEVVLAALTEAGLLTILLKGAALAYTLYPDPALRPMSDLDLLIHPQDLKQAVQVIQSMGYRKMESTSGKGGKNCGWLQQKRETASSPG
jgi:hypothetical protein